MGMRFEWFSADATTVTFVAGGHNADDGGLATDDDYETMVDEDRVALVFGADEAAVFTGTVDELAGLLSRALDALRDGVAA